MIKNLVENFRGELKLVTVLMFSLFLVLFIVALYYLYPLVALGAYVR